MKNCISLVCAIAFVSLSSVSFAGDLVAALAPEERPVNPVWAESEAVLEKALLIRVAELEKLTGIRFSTMLPKVKVSLESSLSQVGGKSVVADYKAETGEIRFLISLMYELTAKHEHKTPLRFQDPELVAKDDSFGELADRILGYALADGISRHIGKGPYFTVKHFYELTDEEQFGLNIVMTGIGGYFQSIRYPQEGNLSSRYFPNSMRQARFYNEDAIILQGGLWLVKDILSQYKEEGIAWLISHPFIAGDLLRDAAIKYREQGLDDLER